MSQPDDEVHVIRVLSDPTDRRQQVHVIPDTHARAAAVRGDVEVVPVLPGSAYDRGPKG